MNVLLGICKLLLSLLAIAALTIAGVNAVVVLSTQGNIVSAEAAKDYSADCILVLGASVLPDGTPSPILQDRLEVGAQLYFMGAAPKVIVSGDNREASYNEVAAMKGYLVGLGVPSEDVFCDHAGYNTYDSMWRARNIFEVERIVVVTQNYHEYRALFNAKGVGMQACGVSSDLRVYADQRFYDLREVLARVKDCWQVVTGAPATVQGEKVPLDQSGDVTDW